MNMEVQGDYQIKRKDLRQYYASFGNIPLSDKAVWNLSLADSVLPDHHIGFKAWISCVAGVTCHRYELQQWCMSLASQIAIMKPKWGVRAVTFCPSYEHNWGEQASLDGLTQALLDKSPSVLSRCTEFGCDRRDYTKIRNFVAGAVIAAMWQYEEQLIWAFRQN